MNCCILSVGTELLFGQIINTNAGFLSKELNNLGVNVLYHRVVGDNADRLKSQLIEASRDCDLIITTGGLGPTQDDLTKETIAHLMEKDLILDKSSLDKLKDIFKNRGSDITENNFKQCYFPTECHIIENPNGTAPGFIIESDKNNNFFHRKTAIISLPGPPREMKPMFEKDVVPYIKGFVKEHMYYTFIRTIGIGESLLEEKIKKLMSNRSDNVTIAPYASPGQVKLRIASKNIDADKAKKEVFSCIDEIERIIGEHIYCVGDRDIEDVVISLLREKNLTIATAESCTGGMLAMKLTSIEGASKVFKEGFVTYSNESKIRDLGVPKNIIDNFGAVSTETAIAMADSLKTKTEASIAVSITGVAGPSSSENKSVGLVYMAINYNGKTRVYKHNFSGERNAIRERSTLHILKHIYDLIGGNYKYEK